MTDTITIRVNPRAAQLFRAAPPAQQQKIALLLNQWLTEALDTSETLEELMARVSRTAQAKGMTPEVLQDMLPTDAATAARYGAASDEERLKIQLLVRLLLERPRPSPDALLRRMDEMSDYAEANGLTPEILEAILNDPDAG